MGWDGGRGFGSEWVTLGKVRYEVDGQRVIVTPFGQNMGELQHFAHTVSQKWSVSKLKMFLYTYEK